ncbi:MAG: hypothetical protein EOP83_02620 [Verrucomicrobiaceae bacterium]|nr:MAG: hypothetical protein EOP83_02620 [Verrucomicrobiaceae bacterium]
MAEYRLRAISQHFVLNEDDWRNPDHPKLCDMPCVVEMSFPTMRESATIQRYVYNLVVPWLSDPANGLDGHFTVCMHHENNAKGWRAIFRFSDHRAAMMHKVRWC